MRHLATGLMLGLGLMALGLWACSTDETEDTTDSDGDTIPDSVEIGDDPDNPRDTDNDGTPDYQDTDSDGDTIPDKLEVGDDPDNPTDTDGDGKPNYLEADSDDDGIPDETEAGDDPTHPQDLDGDGAPDYLDSDSDGDGVPDSTDATTIDDNEIKTGCDNLFEFCPDGLSIQSITDVAECQTIYACVVEFYTDDARCMGLLIDGWTCLETMVSADTCTTCNEMILQLEITGCTRPDPCLPAKDGGV